jgi:hypothetical protein
MVKGLQGEEVSQVLRDAGFAEAAVALTAGGVRVATSGFRAYEHNGTVRLGYWPAEDEFPGVHFDAPGISDRMRDMDDAYTAALVAAGYTVDRSSGAVVVTGKAA